MNKDGSKNIYDMQILCYNKQGVSRVQRLLMLLVRRIVINIRFDSLNISFNRASEMNGNIERSSLVYPLNANYRCVAYR